MSMLAHSSLGCSQGLNISSLGVGRMLHPQPLLMLVWLMVLQLELVVGTIIVVLVVLVLARLRCLLIPVAVSACLVHTCCRAWR